MIATGWGGLYLPPPPLGGVGEDESLYPPPPPSPRRRLEAKGRHCWVSDLRLPDLGLEENLLSTVIRRQNFAHVLL
jgi:hypothetical protein